MSCWSAAPEFCSRLFCIESSIPRCGRISPPISSKRNGWIDGNQLYGPHLSETNPPLIIWFSVLPVLFASWMHGSPVLFLRLLVVGMIVVTVAWCLQILRRSEAFTNRLSLGLIGFAIAGAELINRTDGFAEREHLFLILFLPYLFAVATGVASRLPRAERCLLGVAAGLAIWFKPHQVLVLVALEIFLALRARSLRRMLQLEFLSVVVSCLLVLAATLIFAPLYFQQTYPILVDTYWALGTNSAFGIALTFYHFLLGSVAMLVLWLLVRRRLRDPRTSLALLICGVAASVAADLQHTVWAYHRLPAIALFSVSVAYLLIDLCNPLLRRFAANARAVRWTTLTASAVAAVFLCVVAVRPRLAFSGTQRLEDEPGLQSYLAHVDPTATVYAFSTGVPALSQVYNMGFHWGSRFAHLWMLPALVQNELGPVDPPAPFKRLSPPRLAELSSILRGDMAEDLKYWHPSVVFVHQCAPANPCQGFEGKNFDMISWFERDPRFAAQWSHYERQPSIGYYDVYKRRP